MARAKITAYVTPDLADALKRVAAIKHRSISDIVEDAIAAAFANTGREVEHAALMARLEAVSRRIGVLEKGQETHFELTAHFARFAMSMAPDIPEADRPTLNARGAERFRNVIASIISRLSGGKSVWRESFLAASETRTAAATQNPVTAE
jgi:uncharacterized protein (DUF1778 family)